MTKLRYLIPIGAVLLPGVLQAQSSSGLLSNYQLEIAITIAAIVCIIAFIALVVAWWGLRTIIRQRLAEQGVQLDESLIAARPGEEHLGFWARLWDRLNAAVPVEQEASVATDHDYDGIRELDNRLPPWWLWSFYFTIAFGVAYIGYYHFGSGPSQDEEFRMAMAEAEAELMARKADSPASLIDETNVTLLIDEALVLKGANIYKANCAVCHGADGGGGVGPNFTDKYWLHGGDLKSIFKVVKYGVPQKGMIPWESQLTPEQIQQVSSYIYGMEGTTPETPKEPQGELFERVAEESAPQDSTAVE